MLYWWKTGLFTFPLIHLSDTLTQRDLWYVLFFYSMRSFPLKQLWVKSLAEGLNGGNSSIIPSGVLTYNLACFICGLTTKPQPHHCPNHLWVEFGSKPLHPVGMFVCVRKHYKFQSAQIRLANKHFIFHFAQNFVVSLQTGEMCQGLHHMFVLPSYWKMFSLFLSCMLILSLEIHKGWDAERNCTDTLYMPIPENVVNAVAITTTSVVMEKVHIIFQEVLMRK